MDVSPAYALAVGQIIWIDLLLSGDNAVVIALACRSLATSSGAGAFCWAPGAAIGLRAFCLP
jgi:predicted tellurium resistance membrane protein TerC